MEIEKIKINQYGKLDNKEINFKKINLIYGKNETGKSTLLNFITSMFYGISKNKNGKKYSDYDKYYPWNKNEFSGIINYKLDNQKKYYVYRNFEKKNPKIYDENNNDITEKYNIDKKIGNQFFIEQTGIEKEILESTVITNQKEIEINSNTQNNLLQKIANLAESGSEETSYKTVITKLDKLLLNEVGTERSQEKPINIVKENINDYEERINEIKKYKDYKYECESKSNEIKEQLEEEKSNKIIYDKIKILINNDKKEQEKINIKKDIIEENNKKIEKNNKEKIQKDKNKKKKNIIFILMFLILMNLINFILLKNKILNYILFSLILIFLIYIIIKYKLNNSKLLEKDTKLIEENNLKLKKETEKLQEQLLKNNKIEKEKLIKEYGNNINDLFNSGIEEIAEQNKEEINKLELELHKTELDRENIEPKLDELIEYEELLSVEREKLEELNEQTKVFKITKELMQESYQEMKKNVMPKFSETLSKNIEKISDKSYNKIIIGDEINVELENGDYLPIEKLSIGTIEQIYLSLRLSVIKELSKETIPIILDEAFAYFDDDRLKETLQYLNKTENQVIILTCTNREKDLLEKMKMEFNYVEL